MAEQWLSIVEYARSYSVSDMTVRRRIKTGKLHAVLKEGKYYIPVPVDNGGQTRVSSAREQSQQTQRGSHREVSPRRPEISVVKSHPSAQSTFPTVSTVSEDLAPVTSILAPDSPVPNSLRTGMEQQPSTSVDSRALLAFCDGSLRSANAAEKRTEELYRTKFESMSLQLKAKDVEINSLRQQIEDMQLLVQILEKKRI